MKIKLSRIIVTLTQFTRSNRYGTPIVLHAVNPTHKRYLGTYGAAVEPTNHKLVRYNSAYGTSEADKNDKENRVVQHKLYDKPILYSALRPTFRRIWRGIVPYFAGSMLQLADTAFWVMLGVCLLCRTSAERGDWDQ